MWGYTRVIKYEVAKSMDQNRIGAVFEEVEWLHEVLDTPNASYETRRSIVRGRVAQLAIEGIVVGDVLEELGARRRVEILDGVAHWSDL